MKKTWLAIVNILFLSLGGIGGYFLSNYSSFFILHNHIVLPKDTILKPKVLFHGSTNKHIKSIEPRAIGTRDQSEGSVVFATPDIGFASCFLTRWNDSWIRQGSFDWYHFYIICSDKKRFLENDKGGAIYVLPSDDFHSDLTKGMRSAEWTTNKPVKPLYKMEFDSCLEAMMSFGVQVFFVDKETLDAINKATTLERIKIINTLESENKKRGFQVLQITPEIEK